MTSTSIARRPLRAYLLWLVLATLLPGVIGASLLFVNEYQKGRAQVERKTLQTVRALVLNVENRLNKAQAVGQTLTVLDAIEARDFARVHQQAREALSLAGGGMVMVLRDREGQQLVNTAVEWGTPLPREPSPQLDKIFASGQPAVSPIFTAAVTRKPTVSVDMPVREGDAIPLVLSIGLQSAYFGGILAPAALPEGAVATIFDAGGVIFNRNLRPEASIGKRVTAPLLAGLNRSQEDVIDSRSQEGVPVLTHFARSRSTGWGVAIALPRETLRAELAEQLAWVAGGIALLFAIGLCLAWLIGGRLARSVQALGAPALALGRGEQPRIADQFYVRETADVAAAIQDAALLLEQRSNELSAKESALRETHVLARFGTWQWRLGSHAIEVSASVPHIFGRELPSFAEQRGAVLSEASWEQVRSLTAELARSGGSGQLQLSARHADGHTIWLDYRCESVHGADGRVVAVRGTMQDVTERVRAEEALRQADQRKNEFLAMLGHELRNPLAPIASGAQLLGQASLDPARVQHISGIIARQARHMAGLVDDLLDVSRVTRGLVVLAKERTDLNAVVVDAAEQVQALVREKQHTLDLQLLPRPAWVLGDRKRLVQVVGNLLHNAAKFTGPGGRIEVAPGLDADAVTLEVRDNGIGMLPGELERAFDMFVQGERTPDRSSGGLGIGLALVRSLVELHGGSVGVASAGQGMGAIFTVRLPRLADEEAAPGADVPAQPGATAGGLRVLVVDDNVDAAQILAMYVGAQGHTVAVEHEPEAALAHAPTFAPEVCLLDIGLPGMDGHELARRLRQLPGTRDALLVAVTGYGQEQDRVNSAQAGFDHHLVKPVDMAALEAILQEAPAVLAARRATR
ncbi:ATP-binding protein [uncultured Massilia sp.]|uniref:hybrid sensor histidine kinase/response regulator n=1 Tax=uncultured Massilia sp. TaxID=169973 RepID=UPI00258B9CB4|nr:ATP-binding protein [uncultured Massilia sp.]